MSEPARIDDLSMWEKLWDGLKGDDARAVVILKHSTRCGISFSARKEFLQYMESAGEAAGARHFEVDVVAGRDISQRIAADTSIRHESPQVLVLGAGRKVLWNASHYSITSKAVKEAAERFGV